jgi:arginine N-succinyltransferase
VFRIRQSFRSDIDDILAVARHLDTVNLPADRGRLERILDLSSESFDGEVEPAEREYLFVLEDTEAGAVIGTSMIHAQHGTRRAPHVYFQILQDERYSETLDRYFVHRCLRIGYNYNGPTEIGGLILLPEYRGNPARLGTLLSYMRFLYIAMHREVFRDQVLSELLPPLTEDGTSILWEHLGRKFTGLSYQEADLISKDNKEFIRALFPHELIYTALLPSEVQDVIGVVGPETRGVEKILRRIGFEYAQQIDPFDGGPHFIARTDDISLVAASHQARVQRVEATPDDAPWAIVAVDRDREPRFQATGARVLRDGDELTIPGACAALLGLEPGDQVWTVQP